MLDNVDIRDCDHCADLRYALIVYLKGLVPLDQRYTPDEEYTIVVAGHAETHLGEGMPA